MPAYDSNGELNYGFYQNNNDILFDPMYVIDNSLNSSFTSIIDLKKDEWIIKLHLDNVKDSVTNHSFPDYVDAFSEYFNSGDSKLNNKVYFPWTLFPTLTSYSNFCNLYNNIIKEEINTDGTVSIDEYVHGTNSTFVDAFKDLNWRPVYINFYEQQQVSSFNNHSVLVLNNPDNDLYENVASVTANCFNEFYIDCYYDPRCFPILDKYIYSKNGKSVIDISYCNLLKQQDSIVNNLSVYNNVSFSIK